MQMAPSPALRRLAGGEELEVLDGAEGDASHGFAITETRVVHVDHDILLAGRLSQIRQSARPQPLRAHRTHELVGVRGPRSPLDLPAGDYARVAEPGLTRTRRGSASGQQNERRPYPASEC